jgi:hypothetical protein
MKKRYFYTILILLVGLALVWKTCRRSLQTYTKDSVEMRVNSKFTTDESKNQAEKIDNKIQNYAEKIQDFFKDADAQINFYGCVIDQEGIGMQGATINYQLERAGRLMVDGSIANNNQKAKCLSADHGLFSIQGAKGLTLTILSVEKEGYRDGKQNVRSFGYRGTPNLHNPDLRMPVNFLLISNNIPKTIKLYDKRLTFSWNQGPIEIPISSVGKITISPKRDWKLGQLRDFDWEVEISIDGADLQEIEMGYAKIAPKEGYKRSFKYGSNKGDSQWAGGIQKHYTFRTKSGLYGLINFDLATDREDGDQSTTLEVRLNESGSRNLD